MGVVQRPATLQLTYDIYLPYIPEPNPHPFYSFRGPKKSDADYNRVRIRFAVESWILEKMMEPLYVPVRTILTYLLHGAESFLRS